MSSPKLLHHCLEASVQRWPDRIAVVEPGGAVMTYRELGALSDAVRDRLWTMGVRPGDRVGIYLHKSIDSVATIFGVLKVGAAYVPVDPTAPVRRNAVIFADCTVAAVVTESSVAARLQCESQTFGHAPAVVCLEGVGGGEPLRRALDAGVAPATRRTPRAAASMDDLAYILYTSGSTGRPKGVMLSHRNATSFVDWCSQTFAPTEQDRFSSHAPFHFDLSILDLYVCLKHGGRVLLIDEELGKDPARLAEVISGQRLTVWYSTPSTLTLLLQYGGLERHDLSALRLVLFAGEVFPMKHLHALMALLPHPTYFNLYGPTETNVCTYYRVPPSLQAGRTTPLPIGQVCSHLRAKLVNETRREVRDGEEGELVVAGAGVMQGYWNLPERTCEAFLQDGSAGPWYRTGDIAVQTGGGYVYVGRRDRMVKKRGYRVELGEIEAALYRHPKIHEAAVIATNGEEGVYLKAFVTCRAGEGRPSIIDLKQFSAAELPGYMIPDRFAFCDAIPKTSTDKVDYQRLKEMV
jgi:amino acid adenylation domain-containing protein